MNRPIRFLIAFVLLVGAGFPSAHAEVDCEEPLALTDAKQGKCKKGELELKCGCITPPKITKKVDPYFPASARSLGITGLVVLFAVINTDGKIDEVKVIHAAPEKRGFEAAAIDAVKKWRYQPATIRGKEVSVSFTVNMDFHFR